MESGRSEAVGAKCVEVWDLGAFYLPHLNGIPKPGHHFVKSRMMNLQKVSLLPAIHTIDVLGLFVVAEGYILPERLTCAMVRLRVGS